MFHILKQCIGQVLNPDQLIRNRYSVFKSLLNSDRDCHHLLAKLEEIYYTGKPIDITRIRVLFHDLSASVKAMIGALHELAPGQYRNLSAYHKKLDFYGRFALARPQTVSAGPYVLSLEDRYTDDCLVGGKALHLTQLKNVLNLPVPRGFILSTSAWNSIVEHNVLREKIDQALAELDTDSLASLQTVSGRLRAFIQSATIPEAIASAIREAAQSLAAGQDVLFAIRSSAVAEDSDLSFAGQYLSVLNVPQEEIHSAYLDVLASKYTPEALLYRIYNGLDDQAAPMAVLVLEMVRAEKSGVVITSGTEQEQSRHVSVSMVKGFGDKLMSGEVKPEKIDISYSVGQPVCTTGASTTGLPEKVLHQLLSSTQQIDDYYLVPQEIEWSYDQKGDLYFLQSRRLSRPMVSGRAHPTQEVPALPLLFQGGETAAPGVACGTIFKLQQTNPLPEIPQGSILVCAITPPFLVSLLPKLGGVIASEGSTADHFSSVSREFGVPVLLQAGKVIEQLQTGEMVVLDADNRCVFQGAADVPESLNPRKRLSPESPVGAILKMVIHFTSPLTLLDPAAGNFKPEGCRSLHDIIRFVHEKGVQAMFLKNPDSFFRKPTTIRLTSEIPLQVFLIDVGDGIRKKRDSPHAATPAEITCKPFTALWQGMSHPGVNWRDRNHFDWASYDTIALAGGVARKNDSDLASYCLVSQEYLNITIRFGYHFTLIDCLCGTIPEENYILLRFAGGGGTESGKDLRLRFIRTILESLEFVCEQSSQLLDARLMRYDCAAICAKMEQFGQLLGSVRLLDMVLKHEEELAPLVEKFFSGVYDFSCN